MGIGKILKIAVKYELLSFKRYILVKKSRTIGLIIGLTIFAIYALGVYTILNNPLVADFLRGYLRQIIGGFISAGFFMCLLAISLGFSIVTQVRKGQRQKINLLLQSPIKPINVFFVFVLINSLTVMLFYILMAYPPMIAILLVLGIHSVRVFLFLAIFTMYITSFASIGVALGILYIKLTRKQKVIISVILMAFVAFIYAQIYAPESEFINVLMGISGVLDNYFSPFRWIIAPLIDEGVILYLELILAIILPILIVLAVSYYLTEKYVSGRIKAPIERIVVKRKYRKGLLDKIFGPQLGGIVRKETKIFMRDPSMFSSFVFVFILLVVLLINFTRTPHEDPFELLFITQMFSMLIVVLAPMMILQTSLALERRNMALILSSPIKPEKIVIGKALIGEIIAYITIIVLFPILIYAGIDIQTIVIYSLLLINVVLLATAVSAYISTKYTDFRAENPRKALKTTGGLIMAGIFMAFYIPLPLIMSIIFTYGLHAIIAPTLAAIIPITYTLRRKVIKKAGKILEQIEATEYL